MAAVDPSIVELLRQASEDRSKLVTIVDRVVVKLVASDLAYKLRMPCGMVGVHPSSRDGYGVHDAEVHALGSDIVAMGWSWAACSHAICQKDDDTKHIESSQCCCRRRQICLARMSQARSKSEV